MGIVLAIGDLENENIDWKHGDIVTKQMIEGEGVNRYAMPYSAFEDELRRVELYEYFYGPMSDTSERKQPICHEHPGVTDLLESDVRLFEETRDDLYEPSCLVNWLCFWSRWALDNALHPVIMNH